MSDASTTGLSAEETGAPVTTGGTMGGTTTGPSTDDSTTLGGTDATTAGDSAGESSSDATTGVPLCMPGPGEALGPCRPTRDDQCDPDLLCLTTPDGSICQPTCADCHAGEHDACVAGSCTTMSTPSNCGAYGVACAPGDACVPIATGGGTARASPAAVARSMIPVPLGIGPTRPSASAPWRIASAAAAGLVMQQTLTRVRNQALSPPPGAAIASAGPLL